MKLFLYYVSHTFKNQLKKIFKSWIVIFILACAVFGGLMGLVGGLLSSAASRRADEIRDKIREEAILREEEADVSAEDAAEEEDGTEADTPEEYMIQFSFGKLFSGNISKMGIFELIAGGLILLILIIEVLFAEKSGAKIFLPADVNLLFPSPLKPQAVLMFRLMTQMGVLLLSSLYMVFQLPNLTLNLGLSTGAAIAVLGAWLLLLIFSLLLQTWLYTLSASQDGKRIPIRNIIYVVLGAAGAGFVIYFLRSGKSIIDAADGFFNARVSRYIPVWGWMKGFFMGIIEGNYAEGFIFLGLLLASLAGLLIAIYRMKADFYEDAMAKSEETAQLIREAKEKGGFAMRKRKKDRSEKLLRDGLHRGEGANVFFWKTMYNRRRFGYLGYFTKTTFTYLVLGVGAALIIFFTKPKLPFEAFTITALLFAAIVFYRSIGNPLDQDIRVDYFRLIPENTFRKLFWSFAGGSCNCLLDLLPAVILTAVILKAPVLTVPGWLLFLVSMDAYSTSVASFLDLSVPQNAGGTVKRFVQILFVYFGMMPVGILIGVGIVFEILPVMLVIATGLNFGLAALFLMIMSRIISRGK